MNVFLLITSLIIGSSYSSEDFHYYNTTLQAQGLPLVNKVFVDHGKIKDKKEFFKFVDELKTLDRFKNYQNGELNGILLFFDNKKDTLEALNKLDKYSAYPVVIYEGIECTTTGEILVHVHPSVNKTDFVKRINTVAEGNFKIEETKPKVYSIVVNRLQNPSNILIFANLIANDKFWTDMARVYWIPLDGYVKANTTVETPSISHLGELRTLKLTVNVMDPNIKVRTDLLPQLGQGLQSFPFAGEVWFDPQPFKINEINKKSGKVITVEYLFRQLQFGNFVFQPIVVSYERNGELLTTKTDTCQYAIRSVIAGTGIEDIQPRGNDGLNLVILPPVGAPMADPMKDIYWYAKVVISSTCFSIAFVLLFGVVIAIQRSVTRWLQPKKNAELWEELLWTNFAPIKDCYLVVSRSLNKLLANGYGVSLYSVNRNKCTDNFKNLVNELDKLYQPNACYNTRSLKGFVKEFCKDRRYK